MGLKISGGRIVVFGNSDFISNRKSAVFANQQLFLQTINWSLPSSQSLNIPLKRLNDHQLVMSNDALNKLLYTLWPPTCALIIGLG